jgi:AraC-like DNA-binding protein
VKVILRFGEPVRSAAGTSGPVPATASALVVGVKDTPGRTTHAGEVHSLQLQMTPLAAYRVLGVPMQALSGSAVDLADVLGPAGNLLVERLALTEDWDARFRLLGRVLNERTAAGEPPDPAFAWAWRRLNRSGGAVAIGELAAELGMSRRHLNRRFHHQVGLPPKNLARVLRFRRAVRLHAMAPKRSWSRIAAECGYYDHAHLNADFRALAGCTPTEFVTRSDVLALPA